MPKPHTPFQWFGQATREEIKESRLTSKRVSEERASALKPHDPETSLLEGAFARGDQAIGRVIEEAVRLGCRFDGWTECFDFAKWTEAFQELRARPRGLCLPKLRPRRAASLGHVQSGVTQGVPEAGIHGARSAEVTPNCRAECEHCGIGCKDGGTADSGNRLLPSDRPRNKNQVMPSASADKAPWPQELTTRIRMRYYQDRQAALSVPPRPHDAFPAGRGPGRIPIAFSRGLTRTRRSPSARRFPSAWRARRNTLTWRPIRLSTCSDYQGI